MEEQAKPLTDNLPKSCLDQKQYHIYFYFRHSYTKYPRTPVIVWLSGWLLAKLLPEVLWLPDVVL